MENVRFYEEYESPRDKRQHKGNGNVFALFVWSGQDRSRLGGIGALYDTPNSPVCGTGVSVDWLRKKCRRISEQRAREIHPRLFERLDAS